MDEQIRVMDNEQCALRGHEFRNKRPGRYTVLSVSEPSQRILANVTLRAKRRQVRVVAHVSDVDSGRGLVKLSLWCSVGLRNCRFFLLSPRTGRRRPCGRSVWVAAPMSHVVGVRDEWGCEAFVSVVFSDKVWERRVEGGPIDDARQLFALPEPSSRIISSRPKSQKPAGLLVCHDYKRNYHAGDGQDTYWGLQAWEQYSLLHWASTDVFVFFSHRFISPPPRGWVLAANRNNCPVLGTVMIERVHDAEALFRQPEAGALRLAQMASLGGFAGWLVNIEVDLSPKLVPAVVKFLSKLKETHLVFMYDCFTVLGKNKCQANVTGWNRLFVDTVDGFFLNYEWSAEWLPSVIGRKVFAGVDVFGRGLHDGGFKSGAAVAAAISKNVSAALFAPGWSLEVHGHDQADEEVWSGCPWRAAEFSEFQKNFSSHLTTRRSVLSLQDVGAGIVRIMVEIFARKFPSTTACPPYTVRVRCISGGKCEPQYVSSVDAGYVTLSLGINRANVSEAEPITIELEDACSPCIVLGQSVVRYASTAWPCANGVKASLPAKVVALRTGQSSFFCVGKGDAFWVDGRVWRSEAWANIGYQSLMPNFQYSSDFVMDIDFEHAVSFGSSLRLLAKTDAVRIPLFSIESTGVLVVTSLGPISVFVGETRLTSVSSSEILSSGWTETRFRLVDTNGVLSVSLPQLEARLGFVAFESCMPLPCAIWIPRFVDETDRSQCVLSWSTSQTHGFSVVDVFAFGKLLARSLPDTGRIAIKGSCESLFSAELRFH